MGYHRNDPYFDDYYHQACLAKQSAGAKLKHLLCLNNLRDGNARTHANSEPHPLLWVAELRSVAFLRRPSPLFEVDLPNSPSTGCIEQKMFEKPLKHEPMLIAGVTIEGGFFSSSWLILTGSFNLINFPMEDIS